MKLAEKRFLGILKAALWDEKPVLEQLPEGEKDWSDVLSIASKQSTLGLVFDVAQQLPIAQQPSASQMRKLLMHNVRTEQMHKTIEQSLADVTLSLAKRGITGVLLKGEGTALNYPRPYARACGDIDLYIGEANYRKACRAVEDDDLGERNDHDDTKHLHIDLKSGVILEIHRRSAKVYRMWKSTLLLNHLNQHLLKESTRFLVLEDGLKVKLPTATFDAFFIFYHAYFHFLAGGLGIRQVCDWALHLNRYFDDIDKYQINTMLKDFGLIEQWQIFGYIAVHYLGLSIQKMPFYSDSSSISKKASLVLSTILVEGNFGYYANKKGERPDSFLHSKLHSLRIITSRIHKLLKVSIADVLFYYSHFITFGAYITLKEQIRIWVYNDKRSRH